MRNIPVNVWIADVPVDDFPVVPGLDIQRVVVEMAFSQVFVEMAFSQVQRPYFYFFIGFSSPPPTAPTAA